MKSALRVDSLAVVDPSKNQATGEENEIIKEIIKAYLAEKRKNINEGDDKKIIKKQKNEENIKEIQKNEENIKEIKKNE